jgi:hypothetical protein
LKKKKNASASQNTQVQVWQAKVSCSGQIAVADSKKERFSKVKLEITKRENPNNN